MYIFCVCCFWGWGWYPCSIFLLFCIKRIPAAETLPAEKNEDPILHAERQRENTVQSLRGCTVFMYHRVTCPLSGQPSLPRAGSRISLTKRSVCSGASPT